MNCLTLRFRDSEIEAAFQKSKSSRSLLFEKIFIVLDIGVCCSELLAYFFPVIPSYENGVDLIALLVNLLTLLFAIILLFLVKKFQFIKERAGTFYIITTALILTEYSISIGNILNLVFV